MSHRHYYFTGADGQARGPFADYEIAELVKRQLLIAETPVMNDQGDMLLAGQIADLVRYKDNPPSDGHAPPPLPAPKLPRVLQRRYLIAGAIFIGILQLCSWYYRFMGWDIPHLPAPSIDRSRGE